MFCLTLNVHNTDTPELTAATIAIVSDVEWIISHLLVQTHALSLQNAFTVLKITQPTTKAAQFTKNFDVEKYPTHQVIKHIIIIKLNLKCTK